MRGVMLCLSSFVHVFFSKQQTAYDMRISDGSSDVCSSDLAAAHRLDILDAQRLLAHPAVHLQCPDGADDHGGGRREAGLAALDVEELLGDRKSVVWGKRVSVRVDLADRRILKKKRKRTINIQYSYA